MLTEMLPRPCAKMVATHKLLPLAAHLVGAGVYRFNEEEIYYARRDKLEVREPLYTQCVIVRLAAGGQGACCGG